MSNAFYLFLSLERRKGGPNSIAEKLIASLNIHSTNRPALGSWRKQNLKELRSMLNKPIKARSDSSVCY